MQKKIELLAPAKSFESMLIAYNAGADAVYAGGQKFSARAFANNFNEEEIIEAIKVSHLFNKKFYLAINTIFKQNEIANELYPYIKPLYNNGLDACIICDLGAIAFIKKYFPDMDIHISTQASVNSYQSALFYQKAGATRVVPAREMTLDEIKKIRESTDLEIETFVHGALCYAYSGQCLFSSMLGSRSGNRGRCAQPCRMPYDIITNEGKKINSKPIHPLSLKDMCTIDLIPNLIKAGINSFKIEGRMKSLEYVATITSIYRKYVDLALSNKKFNIEKEDMDNLYTIYNRGGFSRGYYEGFRDKMVSVKGSIKKGKLFDNTQKLSLLKIKMTEEYIEKRLKKRVEFIFTATMDKPIELSVLCDDKNIKVYGTPTQKANKKMNVDDIKKNILALGNSFFESYNIKINVDEDVFFPIGQLKKMRREALDKLLEQFTLKRKANEYTNDRKITTVNKKSKVYVSVNNYNQFEVVIKYPIDYIFINTANFEMELVYDIIKKYTDIFIELPIIYSKKSEEIIDKYANDCGFVIKNIDSLQYLIKNYPNTKKIFYSNMNINNSFAFEFIKKFNVLDVVYPLELTQKEIDEINCKNHIYYAYGHIPLMVTKQSIKDVVSEKIIHNVKLRDRKSVEFNMLEQNEGEYSIILNSTVHYLLDKYEKESILLDFTIENKEKVNEILYGIFNNKIIEPKNFTRGHYNRKID